MAPLTIRNCLMSISELFEAVEAVQSSQSAISVTRIYVYCINQPGTLISSCGKRAANEALQSTARLSLAVELRNFGEDLVHLAFEVESLDETIAALDAKGVKVTDGPTHLSSDSRFMFIDAPDGYEIELIERPPG